MEYAIVHMNWGVGGVERFVQQETKVCSRHTFRNEVTEAKVGARNKRVSLNETDENTLKRTPSAIKIKTKQKYT